MKRILMVFSLILAGIFAAFPVFAAQQEIVINGSTTVLPVMQKAGEAFMAANPDISLAISGGGSGNGIKALNEGLCDIAMSSRDIKQTEVEQGKAKGVTPVRTSVAVDALLPVVHPKNVVDKLTTDQLRDIYAGKITNWKDLGGKDENIVVISRDTSSGTYETWVERIMKKEKVSPTALLQASNGAVTQAVAKNEKAIGYIGLGYLNNSLKKVDVDGVEATAQTALSGRWPIARELYIFTDGQPTGAVKKLVDFLVDPRKGQKIVAEIGFIPLQK